MNLELFAENKIEEVSGIVRARWSYSKIGILRQCRRRYYYQYYGSNKKVALVERDKDKLVFLKSLKNEYLIQGEMIHLIIKTFFHKSKIGEQWTLERLISWARKMLIENISYSINIEKGMNSEYKPNIVKEIFEKKQNPRDLFKEMFEKISICLINFYSSNVFCKLREGSKLPNSKIEVSCSFEIDACNKVEGKVDTCYYDDAKLIIVDWKTGKEEIEDTSLQLLVYVLWAINKNNYSEEEVEIKKAYLFENKVENLEFSQEHLLRAKSKIIQDSFLIREFDEFGKIGKIEAFDKRSEYEDNVCKLCNFKSLCFKN